MPGFDDKRSHRRRNATLVRFYIGRIDCRRLPRGGTGPYAFAEPVVMIDRMISGRNGFGE
jgi:hypothetical protein